MMKYKVGDKVKIKTWEQMEREFGLMGCRNDMEVINCPRKFVADMENSLKAKFPDRVLKIYEVDRDYYNMEGISWFWSDEMIESIYTEIIYEPINNRFEIMDFE